jgi:hypothetical protein
MTMTGKADNEMRLPKRVEAEVSAKAMQSALAERRPLWSGADLQVSRVELSKGLRRAVKSAYSAGRVTRGLEGVEKQLKAEALGLAHVDRRSGAARGQRVSRMVLVADDAAERMYRRVETLSRRHPGRLLVLRLNCSGEELGALLFGPEGVAKLLMLDHKDAVADVLVALATEAGASK